VLLLLLQRPEYFRATVSCPRNGDLMY